MRTLVTGMAPVRRILRSTPMTKITTTALMASMALAVHATGASADSFLEGKSHGMRNCVQTILTGERTDRTRNVHGHHIICRPMVEKSVARGNYRRIILERPRFWMDDAYVVDFRVDDQNALVPNTLRIRTTNGQSTKRLLTDWKDSILATNPATAYFAAQYYNQVRELAGPSPYRGLTYSQVVSLARSVPAFKTKTWETAAFQIALMTIAEHGRAHPPEPVPPIPTRKTARLQQ